VFRFEGVLLIQLCIVEVGIRQYEHDEKIKKHCFW